MDPAIASPPSGTFWVPVRTGRVLAGPHPVIAREGMDERVRRLVDDHGVRQFVDLSSHHDWMPAYRALLPPGCEYTRYEIVDRRLPEDPVALRTLLRRVIAEAEKGRVAYFHCQAGLGRTGTVIALLLRELGFDGQGALDELLRLRVAAHLHEGSPEFDYQREFVRRWAT